MFIFLKYHIFQVKSTVDTLHFSDGVQRSDRVLAYRDPDMKDDMPDKESIGMPNEEEGANEREDNRVHEREVFEKNLKQAGLELVLEPSQVG